MLQRNSGLVPHFSPLEHWSARLAEPSGDLKNEYSSSKLSWRVERQLYIYPFPSFLVCLFYDAVCQCSYGRWQNDWWRIGKDVATCSHILKCSPGIYLEGLRKMTEFLMTVGVPYEFWTQYFPHIFSLDIRISYFDVLLTVHLSIILVINQLNAQNLVL